MGRGVDVARTLVGAAVAAIGSIAGGNRVGELKFEHAPNKNEQSTRIRSSFMAFTSLIIL
jgi:hypothetical protein